MSGERKTYDVTVAGRINDAQFHQARVLARFLATENSSVTTSSIALTETEWEEYVAEKRRVRAGGARVTHQTRARV